MIQFLGYICERGSFILLDGERATLVQKKQFRDVAT